MVIFTILILHSYKKMFTEAVSDVGRSQAEQTSTVYDSADGKYEKIAPYFTQQKEANSYADCPFEIIAMTAASIPVNILFKKEGDKVQEENLSLNLNIEINFFIKFFRKIKNN